MNILFALEMTGYRFQLQIPGVKSSEDWLVLARREVRLMNDNKSETMERHVQTETHKQEKATADKHLTVTPTNKTPKRLKQAKARFSEQLETQVTLKWKASGSDCIAHGVGGKGQKSAWCSG